MLEAFGIDNIRRILHMSRRECLTRMLGQRFFGCARWRNDFINLSSELAMDRRAWGASFWDAVDSVAGTG